MLCRLLGRLWALGPCSVALEMHFGRCLFSFALTGSKGNVPLPPTTALNFVQGPESATKPTIQGQRVGVSASRACVPVGDREAAFICSGQSYPVGPGDPSGSRAAWMQASNSMMSRGWRTVSICRSQDRAGHPGRACGGAGTRWQGGLGHVLADGRCPRGGKGLCAPSGPSAGMAVLPRGPHFFWRLASGVRSFLGK